MKEKNRVGRIKQSSTALRLRARALQIAIEWGASGLQKEIPIATLRMRARALQAAIKRVF